MRALLGAILSLIGAALLLWGIGGALSALAGLYSGALSDPLAVKDGTEQATSAAMWKSVRIGAIGIVPMFLGGWLLRRSVIQRLRGGWGR